MSNLIYYAINEFVMHKEFIENQRSTARDDISDLKAYLENKAKVYCSTGHIKNTCKTVTFIVSRKNKKSTKK